MMTLWVLIIGFALGWWVGRDGERLRQAERDLFANIRRVGEKVKTLQHENEELRAKRGGR